jgi:hypothetical protein
VVAVTIRIELRARLDPVKLSASQGKATR